jgi:hypothetical protein
MVTNPHPSALIQTSDPKYLDGFIWLMNLWIILCFISVGPIFCMFAVTTAKLIVAFAILYGFFSGAGELPDFVDLLVPSEHDSVC